MYGVSTILGRFLTFLLTPLYANILIPSDLAVVAIVYAYVAFLNVVYGYGMESAYMKYTATLELGTRKETFTVPFVSVTVTSLFFSAVLMLQPGTIANLIGLTASDSLIIQYAALILCFDAIALVPFASLRMAGKAKQFALIKLTGILLNVVCNAVLLLQFHMGVEGIFLSGVLSSGCTLLLLIPTIGSNVSRAWGSMLYRALLRFGLPTVPAGIAAMMIQVIDRPVLEALTNKTTVGIYQANYRLGIFMMLVVSMYDFAWRPFFFSHAHEQDAKRTFARILTYFVLSVAGVFLALSFFIQDIVKAPVFFGHSILPSPYWNGLPIVPVILLGYVFLGISNNLVAGIYIEKRTKYLPLVTFAGAGVNVLVNYALIPSMGMMGAAIATLLSYFVMALGMYALAQRFYPIRYEFGRIAKIAMAVILVYGLYAFVPFREWELVWKSGLLVLFVVLISSMKFFEPSELKRLGGLFRLSSKEHEEVPPDVGT